MFACNDHKPCNRLERGSDTYDGNNWMKGKVKEALEIRRSKLDVNMDEELQLGLCIIINRIIRSFGWGGNALLKTFIEWRLCTNSLSCWSALSLLWPFASPVRDAALNFEGNSTLLCSLVSSSCCRLRVMCDANSLPFCSVNARGQLYITICGFLPVKQYLCLYDWVCRFVYCKQQSGQ